MTKTEQVRLCTRLKALYTKMDKLQQKHGFMADCILADHRESLEIEAKLDQAIPGVPWHTIYLAWYHGWDWHPYNPGKKPSPKKGRPKTLDDKRIKELKKDGFSLSQIAEKFGVSRGAIQAALKR